MRLERPMQLPALRADHDYQVCDDPDCGRFPCRVYKDGQQAGYAAGQAAGYAQGYADGAADSG
jgi:hypothetical protein